MTDIGWRQKCLNYPNIMFGRAVANARSRASKRGIPFALTRDEVMKMFEDQGGRCYYSDIKLNVVKSDASRTHDPFKMSLDCVDPTLGYVKDNVVWCAYCVNALKLKMSKKSMIDVCRAIVKKADLH
ncbi:MAG TPA: hypothetical protein EYF95_05505 [Flavobacteriales bacterium]|nr:hypothetical protein [Flavobacteriales bacterium]